MILRNVRNHWRIENNVFNSLDVIWREDDMPWSTKGFALFTLGMLRCLAYNLIQYLRVRHLRGCGQKTSTARKPCLLRHQFLGHPILDVLPVHLWSSSVVTNGSRRQSMRSQRCFLRTDSQSIFLGIIKGSEAGIIGRTRGAVVAVAIHRLGVTPVALGVVEFRIEFRGFEAHGAAAGVI